MHTFSVPLSPPYFFSPTRSVQYKHAATFDTHQTTSLQKVPAEQRTADVERGKLNPLDMTVSQRQTAANRAALQHSQFVQAPPPRQLQRPTTPARVFSSQSPLTETPQHSDQHADARRHLLNTERSCDIREQLYCVLPGPARKAGWDTPSIQSALDLPSLGFTEGSAGERAVRLFDAIASGKLSLQQLQQAEAAQMAALAQDM